MQGFLLGRPMNAAALQALLQLESIELQLAGALHP